MWKTLSERIERVIDDHGSAAEVARVSKASKQLVSHWKHGRVESMATKYAINLSKAWGYSVEWLTEGNGNPMDEKSVGVTRGIDVFNVPVLTAAASMGNGTEMVCDEVIERMTLTGDWIRKTLPGTRPENLSIISGRGNSMEPTYRDGDLLLVDTSIRQVTIDGVYVMSAHGRLFVKTVRQRMDGHYEISSDNPSVKTVDVLNGDHEVIFHGRVVWAWNGKRL